jgi:hypothetical protein
MENIVEKTKKHFHLTLRGELTIKEQAEMLLKPIIILDKAYELFSELKREDFIYREKQCYNICKKEFDKFYTWVFHPYTMDERYKIDDIMTDANEDIDYATIIMENAFHKQIMFLPTKERCVVVKLYVINTIIQVAKQLLKALRQNNDSVAKLDRNIYNLQRAYFTRVYPHKCLVDPNNNIHIHNCVENYINYILKDQIKE